ncbi:hypothetical protein [Schnuerera ultunensis]|uniref:hypothetical protein n=1 Tax=Schnuerera ultunensis TaxID=45497 RepID=UPI00041FA8FF|nr:hypothetical protein [Schnuerera ultunensis]
MEIKSGDILVLKTGNGEYRSRISKIDGDIVKIIDKNGSYRQISIKNVDDMIKNGFSSIEKFD